MRILLIHQNFPGQFRHLASALAAMPQHEVVAIGRDKAPGMDGVRLMRYGLHRDPSPRIHHYLRGHESAVLHGQAVQRVLSGLRDSGWRPDVVVAHPGWGETLFLRDVFPDARLIHFCEYYYHGSGADVGFDPEFPCSVDDLARLRAWNGLHLLNLEQCDAAVTPTRWQHGLHPLAYRDKIVVAHEGVDIDRLGPDPHAVLRLPDGTLLRAGDPVVTYVSRKLEPYRGFHQFMRALPTILQTHPTCRVLVVGADGAGYGRSPVDAPDWRTKLLAENPMDLRRVHFLGRVPYEFYVKLLQVSAAHVYLTYPFVLSWSMLEAMACACPIIGSRTAPVMEVVQDGINGRLVDFFSAHELAEAVLSALRRPKAFRPLRDAARQTVQTRYGVNRGVASYLRLIGEGGSTALAAA